MDAEVEESFNQFEAQLDAEKNAARIEVVEVDTPPPVVIDADHTPLDAIAQQQQQPAADNAAEMQIDEEPVMLLASGSGDATAAEIHTVEARTPPMQTAAVSYVPQPVAAQTAPAPSAPAVSTAQSIRARVEQQSQFDAASGAIDRGPPKLPAQKKPKPTPAPMPPPMMPSAAAAVPVRSPPAPPIIVEIAEEASREFLSQHTVAVDVNENWFDAVSRRTQTLHLCGSE